MAFEKMISKDLYLSFEDCMLINGFVMYETEKVNAKLLLIFLWWSANYKMDIAYITFVKLKIVIFL